MIDRKYTDDDELTLKELEEQFARREKWGWDTDDLEQKREQKEDLAELLERRARLADAIRDDDMPPATREAYEKQIGEIDEVLAEPLEQEAEDVRERARRLRRQGDNFEGRNGYESMAESCREKAAELESKAETLEAKAAGEGGVEALSSSETSGARIESGRDPTRSDPVRVSAYLRAGDVDVDEYDDDRLETLAGMSSQLRDKARLIRAAKQGQTKVPADRLEDRGGIAQNHGV